MYNKFSLNKSFYYKAHRRFYSKFEKAKHYSLKLLLHLYLRKVRQNILHNLPAMFSLILLMKRFLNILTLSSLHTGTIHSKTPSSTANHCSTRKVNLKGIKMKLLIVMILWKKTSVLKFYMKI